MKGISCVPFIGYGMYVHATYKEWEGKKVTFEGKVSRDTVCLVKETFQSEYPGSFKSGIICGIREDYQGSAEFWICFPSEVKGVFYASWVPFRHIDWGNYFKYSQKNN